MTKMPAPEIIFSLQHIAEGLLNSRRRVLEPTTSDYYEALLTGRKSAQIGRKGPARISRADFGDFIAVLLWNKCRIYGVLVVFLWVFWGALVEFLWSSCGALAAHLWRPRRSPGRISEKKSGIIFFRDQNYAVKPMETCENPIFFRSYIFLPRFFRDFSVA